MYGTCRYQVKGREWRLNKTVKPARGGRLTERRPRAHPGGGVFGLHRARLCRDLDARDRNPRAGLQARALCAVRQQAGDAGRLHQRARQAADACRPICPSRATARRCAQAFTAFGAQLLREISDPTVVAVFRLAIAEAVRAPEVATDAERDRHRGQPQRACASSCAARAAAKLLDGEPAEMADQFAGLLWGNRMLGLLLGDRRAAEPARDRAARGSRKRGVPARLSGAALEVGNLQPIEIRRRLREQRGLLALAEHARRGA